MSRIPVVRNAFEVKPKLQKRSWLESVERRRHVLTCLSVADSVALALFLALSWGGEGSWVVRSPLFIVLGYVMATLCSLLVLVWWLVTGDKSILMWYREMSGKGQERTVLASLGAIAACLLACLVLARITRRYSRSESSTLKCIGVLVFIFVMLVIAAFYAANEG